VPKLEKPIISQSPHITSTDNTRGIMFDVIIALLPALIAGTTFFGPRALLLVGTCVASAVIAEYVCCKVFKKPNSIGDLSAVVTGLLLGLNLPSSLPLWMGALGSAIAIVVVKQLFGGIGQNFVNPALVGRIVLMVSFSTAMTTWPNPYAWMNKSLDAISSATPLAKGASYSLQELILGVRPGCIGETFTLVLLAGGIYLVWRKVIRPTIPLSFILTVGALSFATGLFGGSIADAGYNALYSMMSGGLILGAVFMATDYTTSPTTFKGKIIFGIGCGIITYLIRQFGSLNEGVSFSIILMNIIVPHINNLTVPKPFGWEVLKHE